MLGGSSLALLAVVAQLQRRRGGIAAHPAIAATAPHPVGGAACASAVAVARLLGRRAPLIVGRVRGCGGGSGSPARGRYGRRCCGELRAAFEPPLLSAHVRDRRQDIGAAAE